MQPSQLEIQVRDCLRLVGIRITEVVRQAPSESLFWGLAEISGRPPQRIQVSIEVRDPGRAVVRLEWENAVPIEAASFAGARDALLKAALQWEARHPAPVSHPQPSSPVLPSGW